MTIWVLFTWMMLLDPINGSSMKPIASWTFETKQLCEQDAQALLYKYYSCIQVVVPKPKK